jgi:hypothetical protein
MEFDAVEQQVCESRRVKQKVKFSEKNSSTSVSHQDEFYCQLPVTLMLIDIIFNLLVLSVNEEDLLRKLPKRKLL